MIGSRMGHYEITAEIGRGGMGEVYRVRDTKVNRDVTLKILPQVFAQDQERRAPVCTIWPSGAGVSPQLDELVVQSAVVGSQPIKHILERHG